MRTDRAGGKVLANQGGARGRELIPTQRPDFVGAGAVKAKKDSAQAMIGLAQVAQPVCTIAALPQVLPNPVDRHAISVCVKFPVLDAARLDALVHGITYPEQRSRHGFWAIGDTLAEETQVRDRDAADL